MRARRVQDPKEGDDVESRNDPAGAPVIERITELHRETIGLLRKSFPEMKWDEAHLEKFVASPSNILLLASRDGEGCGLVRAHFLQRCDARGKEILLHAMDVVPNYQRQGVATALIKKLKDIAEAENASEIWVLTNRSNTAAFHLYHQTGGVAPHPDDVMFIYDLQEKH